MKKIYKIITKIFLILLLALELNGHIPIIMHHGIGGNHNNFYHYMKWINESFPNRKTFSLNVNSGLK